MMGFFFFAIFCRQLLGGVIFFAYLCTLNKKTELLMNIRNTWMVLAIVSLTVAGCSEKKKSNDLIAPRVVKVTPAEPEQMQEYRFDNDVAWIGRKYRVTIYREPSDSLPMVKDETGQKFVDNVVSLKVSRQDGSVFYNKVFTKATFREYLDDDYRQTGILEGFVFDKADGDDLVFAASVCHPKTDEYIPLVVRLSRMGNLTVKRDTEMDTLPEDADKQH